MHYDSAAAQLESALIEEELREIIQEGRDLSDGADETGQVDDVDQPQTDDVRPVAKADALRTLSGARAYHRGQLVGAYIGRIMGAGRLTPHSNHHELGHVAFQIRTSSRKTFTINPDTESEKIIVGALDRRSGQDGTVTYTLYGVRKVDAAAVGRKSTSRGHRKSRHQMVSLARVQRIELGTLVIPSELVSADDSARRLQLLDRIDGLEVSLHDVVTRAVREFLSDEWQESLDALDAEPAIPDPSGDYFEKMLDEY